ncbi:TonB family protein [Pseudoxanthomonas sp. F37]|uniref:energy transducer TonB n=1 Tax=Pseudoxanthomonas TaxID=83618 RepID=UPI001FD22A50|nr:MULTISPECIES: energy transducer TonB [Pseudoxanthomonas]UOV05316.1 TonB family protein [Pseudoxanthomonas mexicana]UOV10317.1 TonB family protein [Pseudoxanthomonas sp. F37]
MSAPQPHEPHFTLRLPRTALRNAAIAFGAGLLLFLIVWWAGRDDGFYTAQPTLPGKAAPVEALPEPLSTGDGASGMEEPAPRASSDERPQLVEEKPMPTPVPEATAPTPPEATAPLAPGVTLAPGDVPVPIPGQTPAPEYPPAAMRSGDQGTVLVRVEVGADGVPVSVEVAQRSGSRDLDRAAVDAVRQWRFQPAQRDGQAVAGAVTVPIDFKMR